MGYNPNIFSCQNVLIRTSKESNGAKELELAVHMACELYPDPARRREYVVNKLESKSSFPNPLLYSSRN